MAQQRKRTAGDDLRDFKAGKISGNFYHNGIDRSDNYIQHTSAPRYITDENGKTQVASYNEWIQQEVFQHQHDLPNDTSSTSSNNKTATNDISVKSSNNTSSSAGSDIKSFFSGNLNNANSSAEDLKDAIKNPNKSLNDRVKGLTYMYNAAVATGDTKTAEKMQKEYDELADRVNKQTEINRHNAKEYARSQSLKGMTEERKALVDERNKYALDNGLVTSTGIDTRKKDRYKVYSEYNSKIDELDKQIAEKQRNGEYDLSDSQKAVLADIGNKANKLTESFENKYKNSTLEQRLNARLHATTSELNWLNKHMYDNSSSKELEDYNNQLNKEANSLWNQRDEEQAYNRLKAIEDEQGKLKTAIDNAKLSEQKKKEYDDIVNNDIKAKTVLQKYYALQEYLKTDTSDADEADNTDNSYIKKLSENERNKIKADFLKLKDKGYNTESLYKWYEREQEEKKAEDNLDRIKMYAKKHPVIASANSIGQKFVGGVPDAIQYISANIDKKYNGGDGYVNPDTTETAKSEAIRQSVSEKINNDFGSLLYTAGMGIADSTINIVMDRLIPGGSAMGLTLLGTSAGVSGANEVIKNGGSIENAVTTGVANGIAEALFEKISLEQLSAFKASGKSTFRAAVGNVLKGAFTEGSEEAFTDLANRLTDDAINKDLSSYNLSKKNYMEQGMNEAEAENAASWDFWKNVGLDFAGGAISGGVLNLATAGINLAGAKIDMAQNKESNAQIGKAVMADENFDLDLLIRQGLATDKNDRAYNYAHKMQKLVETDNEGKISAGDVGNLMYLINREVGKNPELVNKIAQVKKQNTREQSNQTVNAQNEQSPTQQNTAQNGQQNAEQAQASTVINATKKADTEDIGKMYGVYAFGKKHPNGIIATDTSTGKVVKVALKSLESSAKINRSDEENTLVFNTNDGKQVNADSITFSDSQFDTIVHSANEFDTYGARNYISNFEEWRESPQAQRMTDDEMLYKYNKAYSAAYSFGREGVKLDSLRETSEYKILTNILGEQIVSQALSTGRRDVDINTQHHANRLTELINRNGRADTSGVGVYADSGTEVSHIPQELINTLGNLSQKTGRNIIISDRLADGVNGVAKDGNIILSSEISSQKILATALHEAGHMIKKTNPTEWQTLSDFVSDYLVRKGVDLNKMIDRTIERYGNRLQADEHENTRDAALEEIVCDTLMSIASDEKALNIALSTKQNKSRIAAAIKSLINKVKDWLIDKSKNYGAKAFAKDLEALENLAQRFSEAADTARENITEQSEVQNGEKIDVEKYSMGSTDNIVQAEFEKKVDEIEKNTYNSDNVVIMGITPNILQKIGLAPLPLAMTKNHIYSVAVSDTRAKSEGRYHKNTNYHNLGFDTVKDIYNKISDPLMVIAHPDFAVKKNKSKDSTHKVVVLVDLSVGGKQVIAPITVDYEGMYNNTHIDVNLVATYFDKDNINDYIKEAIALETMGKTGFFYLDKKRTQNIFKKSGYQLPSRLKNSGSNIIIRPIDDIVNKKINNITQSKQFIRWFGDWQNSPAKASKVVDNNGEPLVLYHQTEKEFTTFDTKQKGSGEFDSEMPTGIFMKPTNNDIGVGGNIQMPLYASIKNPLIVNNRSELVKFYDKNVQGYTKAKSAIDSVNKEYKAKFNEEMKRENEEYQKLWNAKKNGEISEEEYQKSISRDALDEIMEEWENKVKEASHNAKALIDDYFKNSNYDGVIVNNDVGSFGRSTKTFIAFENTQVKSATDNIGTFDGNNPDIRYSLDEDYDFTDEKAGAIHDTLNFSIDDEYDDWLVNDDGKSVFDAVKDEKNPDRRISILYHYAGKTAEHGMSVGKDIRIGQSGMHRLVCNVLQEYGVNLNGKNKSRIEAFKSVVNDFENSVKNDTQSFNDAIESLAEECKEYLKKSSLIDKKHSEWAKDLSDSLKEVTLVIPKGDIDFIKSAYGSITNFRKALMGKINIRTAKGYALIESVNEGSIEDVGNSISEIIGDIAGIDDTFNWRSEEGYKTLERFINYDLAEHFVSIDGKSVQSIDEMAIEMAFDVATEYLKQQAKEVVLDNNANKELLHSITEIYNQANEEHELLLKEKNARYAEQISEQKKNAEKQIKSLVRKNNKKTEQYIKNDIKLRNKIKSDAKEYRITLRATKKTVAEEYRAERDKTKYRQKISTTLERLINRHLKPKPSNNVPISVVKPLYRLLSELTGNYSGFSKGVNDITEKTGYNKTDNQEGERVNKVTLSAETEKLISALSSEIANTDGKITLPPAMRNALLGYNVFDNKGNIKQHFTGLLEDVRNIFEKAEKNGKTSLKDFSLSELKRISTAFSEVKKLLDAANKIVINGKEYDAYLVSRKGAEELKKVTGTHKKGSNTQASTAKRTLLAYRKYMSDPIRFARMISGYHNDSVIVQLMEMLNQGQSDAEQLSIDWTNKYEEQMSRFSYKAKKDYVREQAMEFDGIDPNTKEELVDKKTGEQVKVGLTADMLVEMLLEYEDEYGRAHMMYSGYQVPNIKYIKRKNQQLMYSKDSGCYILPTESDISRIRDYVMNNEIAKTVYEICREMYNEDMQNAVNKVSNEKYGYEIAKVKNYCPITIDEDTVYGTFADVLINRSINSRAFLHERENFKYNRLKLKGATAKLTSQIKSVSSWCGLTMPIETFNRVFNMPRYDHKNDSLVKAVQEENLNSAENIRQKNNTHADEEEKSKLSIDEHFTDKYDEWDKKGGRFSFRVGTTSEVLQRLGVDDKNIWWDTSKILKIKNKHPEMTDDILKQVPNVLESPIIVMESYTVKGRLVLFGDVYDAKNNPMLVALELNPIGEGGKSLDIIKIASAYGKDSNLQHMIDKSNILYVEPNEKRTHTWLTGNGLQLPLPSSKYGFSDNIKSQNQGDVKYSVEKEAHSTLSIDEVLDFIEREEKQKKKKKSTPTTEYFPSMKEIMKQQWGNESEEYISKLMGDLQGSTKQADPGRIDMLTGKYIRAVLTANISSAIKQLSSYPLAAARVGWKATLAGLKHIRPGKHTPFLNRALPDSYKQSIPYDEIAKYTPILEYRKRGNNSREMAEISRYKGLIDSSGWVGHTLDRLNWIEKNDVLMVEMNYWIAYEHVKGNMGISPDSKEFMPNVAKTLEDIINNMMPNSSVMQQGQILRSKNPVNRIFTICKSQVFCMVNAAMDASGEYNARLKDYKQAVSKSEKEQARTEVKIAKKQLARTYSAIIVSTAMTCGILMPLIAALFGKWDRYRDEDGNITPWSVGSRLLKDFGSELTGMFLFGDTVYNTVLALIDKNEEFYGLSLPGVDTINDFITGIINIARSDTPEKLRKNISSLVGTLGMLTGLPTKNLMNLFQGACNHIENFTKYGGTPTVNDYGEVSMQMYANYCYEALIDGDKKKFAKLYSEWLKGKTSTGKQVDKSYINSKLKTELEDDTEIIAAGNAFFNGDLTAYENTVEKYSDLGFDKTTVVKAINSIVSDLEDEQKNAEGLDKYDNEEESDSKPELYKYSDAFDFLKNGDTANYEKVEKYLMEHKGKTKNQMKKLMQSASRTDPMFEQYISASKSNDADTTHTLYRQLLNVYGSESRFKSALRKYQDKIKKQKSK